MTGAAMTTGVPLLFVDGHRLLFRTYYGFPAHITSRDRTRDLTALSAQRVARLGTLVTGSALGGGS
jgi:hypothetical protein